MNVTDLYKIIVWMKGQVKKLEASDHYEQIKPRVERLKKYARDLEEGRIKP